MAALIVMKKGFRKSPHRQVYPHHIAKIFQLGIPNILMQSAYTFYILGLNLILATFSDQAVTALGLYYKWQTFFFIPLGAMQTCIVPVISYNYAARNIERCKKTLSASIIFGMSLMAWEHYALSVFRHKCCGYLLPMNWLLLSDGSASALSASAFCQWSLR